MAQADLPPRVYPRMTPSRASKENEAPPVTTNPLISFAGGDETDADQA